MVVQKTVANDVHESESLPVSGSQVPLANSDVEPPLSPVPAQMCVVAISEPAAEMHCDCVGCIVEGPCRYWFYRQWACQRARSTQV